MVYSIFSHQPIAQVGIMYVPTDYKDSVVSWCSFADVVTLVCLHQCSTITIAQPNSLYGTNLKFGVNSLLLKISQLPWVLPPFLPLYLSTCLPVFTSLFMYSCLPCASVSLKDIMSSESL